MSSLLVPVAGLDAVRLFRDCCNVYFLCADDRALLIDLGSGAALHAASRAGLAVEAVYFTHAHRDQCSGAVHAAALDLHFPAGARDFVDIERRDDFALPSPLVERYSGRFDPPRPIARACFDVQPEGYLTSLRWRGFELEVLPLSGHIDHQVAYIVEVSGRRVAFCGDGVHSRGKVHEPYHLETDHYTGSGARAAAEALRSLRQRRPDVLCPSHGPITAGDVWQALAETENRLHTLAELKDSICPGYPAVHCLARPGKGLDRLSEHLYVWGNSYVVFSDEGAAMLIDADGALSEDFWEQYESLLGDRSLEVALATHYHCDHVGGLEQIRARASGMTIWLHEALVEITEHPHRFRRPWLPREAIEIDRRLRDSQPFSWREYTLVPYHFPGQTDLHACYETYVDDHHVVFTGDNFFPPQTWGGMGGLSGLNAGHPIHGWRRSIELMLALRPDWVLSSHMQPFAFHRDHFLAMRAWTDAVADAMRDLTPDGNLERHYSPHIFGLEPYVGHFVDNPVTVRSTVVNSYETRAALALRLVAPNGWKVEPDCVDAEVMPGERHETSWSLRPGCSKDRVAMITLDVTFDGEYLGEKAECYLHRNATTT